MKNFYVHEMQYLLASIPPPVASRGLAVSDLLIVYMRRQPGRGSVSLSVGCRENRKQNSPSTVTPQIGDIT